MALEIRVPTRAEMPDYYLALPFANGLPQWEPAPAAWHGGPEPWPPQRTPATAEQRQQWAEEDSAAPHIHPVAAFDGDRVVGASAMLSMEITVPGGARLAAGGVTSTGVLATHRRQGALRGMMQRMFDDAHRRGEALALLSASEGSIYGRFGFGPATYRTRWEIDRAEAALRPAADDDGRLELVDAATARRHWPDLHAAVRSARAGELSPQPGRWDRLSDEAAGTDGPMRYLLHRDADGGVDGIAHFRLPWSATLEHAGQLVVEAFEATTPEAYRALWGLLLDVDLTRRVVAHTRPRDEPLRWMLVNPRAMRVTRQSDNLWVRLLDVPVAMAARRYGVDDELCFSIRADAMCPRTVGTWRLQVSDGQAVCEPTADPVDLSIEIEALGSLYLGGMSAHDLAAAGRITATDENAVRRFGRLMHVDPEPHNSFVF